MNCLTDWYLWKEAYREDKMAGLKDTTTTLLLLTLIAACCVQLSHQQISRSLFIYTPDNDSSRNYDCNDIRNVQVTSLQATNAPGTEQCQCLLSTRTGDAIDAVLIKNLNDVNRWTETERISITSTGTVAVSFDPVDVSVDGRPQDLPILIEFSK